MAGGLHRWKRDGVDRDGHDVGMVVEDHEWKGWRYGGRRWDAVHIGESGRWSPGRPSRRVGVS